MATLSVIIPTHKRADILRRCLECLEKQTIAKQLEVIVVSDGPDTETEVLMKHILQTEDGPNASLASFIYFEIPKAQQGIARNRGLERATAPLTMFIGDDIFLAPDACEKHVEAHEQCHGERSRTMTSAVPPLGYARDDTAILGFTTWDPSLDITPVMRWLEETGWQFGYPFLEPYRRAFVPPEMQHKFTYTSHISLPTSVAKRTPFREDVTLYGWEDVEWGLRLRKSGVRLWYEPNAVAHHYHRLTMPDSLKRMQELGASAVFLTRVTPELDRLPKGWKKYAYHVLALLPTMKGRHAKAFLRGIAANTICYINFLC